MFAALMEEKQQEILCKVDQLFMRHGMKSVTMDDVAGELKVSKKTLYKYVKDKADLVCQVIRNHCNEDKGVVEEISGRNDNAIDELLEISHYFAGMLQRMHPSVHYDLEKYYPEAWDVFTKEHKEGHVQQTITNNIKKGIKAGLYRKGINISIITKLYISKVDLCFDPVMFPITDYRFTEVQREMLLYHIRGIATTKGLKYLDAQIKKGSI